MLPYEYYDKEKDFRKEPIAILPKHQIFPLSESGLEKYYNQRKYYLEFQKNISKSKDIKNKILNNQFNNSLSSLENPIKSEISNNKNLTEIQETLTDKKKDSKKKISLNKQLYFEPIIIGKTLKNKYLIKHKNQDQSKTNTINGKKSKFRIDLPLINFNKTLGSRKIEVKKFDAFITTSSFCNPYYNHRSYYMGENYNPNNYLLDYSKNRTKRNDFGSLFIN